MKNTPHLKSAAAACLIVLSVGLAACGGSSDESGVADVSGGSATATSTATTTTGAATSQDDRIIAFTRCLREQGIDIADPVPDQNGNLRPNLQGVDQNDLRAAAPECQDEIGGGDQGANPFDNEEFQSAAVEFSRCMRDNGVSAFPDPDFDGATGPIGLFPGYDIQELQNDPETADAVEQCQEAFAGALPGGGGG